jgi:kumamolisin
MSMENERQRAIPEFTRWLPGSERPRPASHRHLGPLHAEEAVAFTLVLRRKPGQPPHAIAGIEKHRAASRHRLSTQEYLETYAADPAEIDTASVSIERQGMMVLEAHAGRRTLSILGTAAQVNTVFGVKLQRYWDPRATELLARASAGGEPVSAHAPRSHRGFDGAVYLPAELAETVVAIVGLDDRFLGAPRGVAVGDAAGARYPHVAAVLQKLNLPNTGAYSETIGILAAQAPGAPGTTPCYLPSDIDHLYFANLPPGYRTRPTSITDIPLTVGSTTYQNDPSPVAAIPSLEHANNAILELTQDIATSITVAQGARVNVYFTEATEQGYLKFLTRVLLPEREKQPTVLSLSLGLYEARDASSRSASGSPGYLIDELFSQIAALGISVFISVCDWNTGKWRLLAAPNLAPIAAPQLEPALRGIMATSSAVASAALSAASLQIAAGAVGGHESDAAHSGHAIPDLGSAVAYSGFFVNGISYSYTGTSCAASFYAGMTAMLRSAFGNGLGFLSSMLFELRKTTPAKRRGDDQDAPGVTGSTTSVTADEQGPAPEAPFFTLARAVPRRRFWNRGMRLIPRVLQRPV